MSVRALRGSVRRRWTDRLLVSISRLSSVSSFARACQLPDTSSSIANSVPRFAIRLSLMLPPHSVITRVSSWTIPVRSLPIADTARCCFIFGGRHANKRTECTVWIRPRRPWPGVPHEFRTCPGRPRLVPSRAPRVCRRRASSLGSWAVFGMFSGSLVAIVTPMHADGGLDFTAWARLIEFHLDNGTSGIVVGGTTGESATLSDAELRELTARACAQAAGTHPGHRRGRHQQYGDHGRSGWAGFRSCRWTGY